MKNILLPSIFVIRFSFVFFSILTLLNCSKKDEEVTPAVLPPETTSGAMTFGCKINGEILTNAPGSNFNATYENRMTGPDKGWFFTTSVTQYTANRFITLEIGTDSLQLVQGITYVISALDPDGGNAYGTYTLQFSSGFEFLNASPHGSGSLYISKLDEVNKIISGTFSFTVYYSSGVLAATISEGRFDIRY